MNGQPSCSCDILQKLMKEHLENMSKFDENLKKEQERTKEALRQKLEERKRKRKQSGADRPSAAEPAGEDEPSSQMGTTQKLEALRLESVRRQAQKQPETEATTMQPGMEDGGVCLFM